MKLSKFLIIFSTTLNSVAAMAAEPSEVCGATFQSFWQINSETKDLQLKSFYRHANIKFCERSMTSSPNAEVQLLDSSKKLIRKFNTYLPIESFQDSVQNGRLVGSVSKPATQNVQIKFAEDGDFKKAKYVKINFLDGASYGPTSL